MKYHEYCIWWKDPFHWPQGSIRRALERRVDVNTKKTICFRRWGQHRHSAGSFLSRRLSLQVSLFYSRGHNVIGQFIGRKLTGRTSRRVNSPCLYVLCSAAEVHRLRRIADDTLFFGCLTYHLLVNSERKTRAIDGMSKERISPTPLQLRFGSGASSMERSLPSRSCPSL